MQVVHDICSLSVVTLCPVSYSLCLALCSGRVTMGYREKRLTCAYIVGNGVVQSWFGFVCKVRFLGYAPCKFVIKSTVFLYHD